MTAAASGGSIEKILLADIGGTNARFAVLADGAVGMIAHMPVRDHAGFVDALRAYLGRLPAAGAIHSAVLAVAGVIENGRAVLTNHPWLIDAAELRTAFGFSSVRLINDFEAVAWSLPHIPRDRLVAIGGRAPVAAAPLAVLGPGTGLGVAACIPLATGHLVVPGEGGHVTLAGCSPREDAVIAWLRQRFGHVSAERVLSGQGLESLYQAIASLDHPALPQRSAVEITRAATEGSCSTCRAALDMFCAMLGTVAGNLALTLGARGGLFIAGGILRQMPDYLVASQFRARFEDKGRFKTYLEPVPAYLITDEDVAFLGLRAMAEADGLG